MKRSNIGLLGRVVSTKRTLYLPLTKNQRSKRQLFISYPPWPTFCSSNSCFICIVLIGQVAWQSCDCCLPQARRWFWSAHAPRGAGDGYPDAEGLHQRFGDGQLSVRWVDLGAGAVPRVTSPFPFLLPCPLSPPINRASERGAVTEGAPVYPIFLIRSQQWWIRAGLRFPCTALTRRRSWKRPRSQPTVSLIVFNTHLRVIYGESTAKQKKLWHKGSLMCHNNLGHGHYFSDRHLPRRVVDAICYHLVGAWSNLLVSPL